MGNQMEKSLSVSESNKAYFEQKRGIKSRRVSRLRYIDNFSEKEAEISSSIFECGGCKWYVTVHPKGDYCCDHLAVYLNVASSKSLNFGWKKRVSYRFVLLNQSGKELQISSTPEEGSLFCDETQSWGYPKVFPLSKLKEEGFLDNNKLIVKVEVKIVEAVDVGEVTGKGMLRIKGFEVPYTQGVLVSKIFVKHPDIAVDFKPKNQVVKTAYMNVLLGLIETLRKPPRSFTDTMLRNAHSELSELTEAGFKLDWLKKKLEEVALERKNAIAGSSRVEELVERIKNMELALSDLKVELKKEIDKAPAASKVLSFDDIL